MRIFNSFSLFQKKRRSLRIKRSRISYLSYPYTRSQSIQMFGMSEILSQSSPIPLWQLWLRIGRRSISKSFDGVVQRKSGSDFNFGQSEILNTWRHGMTVLRRCSSAAFISPIPIHSPHSPKLTSKRVFKFGFYSKKFNTHLFQTIKELYC